MEVIENDCSILLVLRDFYKRFFVKCDGQRSTAKTNLKYNVCVCVCVSVREREREKAKKINYLNKIT